MSDATKIDDGGPAFARPAALNESAVESREQDGMSLRDYFAGQALANVARVYGEFSEMSPDARHRTWLHMAAECYAMADALLAIRGT